MPHKWDSETELANSIVQHLKKDGWTVYPELATIDIIAIKDRPDGTKHIIGIEAKKHFNLTVLDQAYSKKSYVDKMYVAVSEGWKNHESFGCKIAEMFGIGVFTSRKNYSYLENEFPRMGSKYSVHVRVEAAEKPRTKKDYIEKLLHPAAQSYSKPGQPGGHSWTPFVKTCHLLKDYVKEHPECTLDEAISCIKHHYRHGKSAKNNLSIYLRSGYIKGVSLKKNILSFLEIETDDKESKSLSSVN